MEKFGQVQDMPTKIEQDLSQAQLARISRHFGGLVNAKQEPDMYAPLVRTNSFVISL